MFSFIFVWKKRSTGAVLLARYFLQMKTLKRFYLNRPVKKWVYKFRLVIVELHPNITQHCTLFRIASAWPKHRMGPGADRPKLNCVWINKSATLTIPLGAPNGATSPETLNVKGSTYTSSVTLSSQAGEGRQGCRWCEGRNSAGLSVSRVFSPAAPTAHNNDSKCRQVTLLVSSTGFFRSFLMHIKVSWHKDT